MRFQRGSAALSVSKSRCADCGRLVAGREGRREGGREGGSEGGREGRREGGEKSRVSSVVSPAALFENFIL